MKRDTQDTVRTAAGIAAWAVVMAVSQESAARDTLQREHFSRHSDWQAHLMVEAPCGESLIPTLGGSERALMCSDAMHLSSDRNELDGKSQVTDTYLLRGATYYTVHSGTIVAVFR